MDYTKINNVKELEKTIIKLSDAYYNNQPLVSDVIFDNLIDKLKKLKPDSLVLKKIGAPIRKDKKKVKLPIYMSSMDKMYPESNNLKLFKNRTESPYLLSDKIDGAACLLEYKEGNLKGIFTRGDGYVGQDLKFLIGFLKVPLQIKLKNDVYVKGELNVTLKDYQEKYYTEATKPRGVVTGIFNSLEPNLDIINNFIFSAYEISIDNNLMLKPLEQFKLMEQLKFKVPNYKLVDNITSKILEIFLEERRKKSIFEIDGIIISSNCNYKLIEKDNPKHSIAFKVNEEGIETKVLNITWDATKHGILFPVIEVESVIIEGDTIKNVSGKNAKYILENNIGKNSILSIIKSGGVIPEIIKVIKETKTELPKGNYHWDENEVNIVLDNIMENNLVKMKRVLHFFTSFDIKGLKIGIIKKLFDINLNTIDKIIKAKKDDFLEAEGIKEKSATKLYDSIHQVIDKDLDFDKLLFASLCFDKGLGIRRFKLLLNNLPQIYKLETVFRNDILKIDMFGEIIADQFLEGFKEFKKFLKLHPYLKYKKPIKENKIKEGKYKNDYILFSGFRDKELEEKLILEGAVIEKSLTNRVTLLIVNDLNSTNSKVVKAREKNIKIVKK